MPAAELWSRFTCQLRRFQAIELHYCFKAKNEFGSEWVSVKRPRVRYIAPFSLIKRPEPTYADYRRSVRTPRESAIVTDPVPEDGQTIRFLWYQLNCQKSHFLRNQRVPNVSI
jgi:hypothetical protein